jgi:hypothetical protein
MPVSMTFYRHISGGRRITVTLFTALLGAIALFLVPETVYAQSCRRPSGMSDVWDFAARDLDELAAQPGEPQLVEKNVRSLSNNEQGQLEARFRMHVLFPQQFEAFRNAIRDIDRQDEFLPNLEVSEVRCSDGNPVTYALVQQKLAFRFLFFSREYEYVLHYFLDETTGPDAAFNVWWHLAESLDGKIIATDGSWYFEPVVVDGRSYTYMAYGTRTVFREEKTGLRTVMDQFAERNTVAAMQALQERVREMTE